MPVSEIRRKPAAEELDTVHDVGIDQAERALEALKVERVVELQSVEDQRNIPGHTASHVECGRAAADGHSRKKLDHPADVTTERRGENGLLPGHDVA